MKNLLLIALLFIAVLPMVGQADSVEVKKKPTFKNQVDLDIYLYGVGIGYNKQLYKNLSIGISTGGGYILSRSYRNFTKEYDTDFNGLKVRKESHNIFLFEYLNMYTFLNYTIANKISFNTGIKYAIVETDSGLNGYIIGYNLGIFYKNSKFSLGIEQSLVNYSAYDRGDIKAKLLTTSFLILKFPLKKW